MEIIKDIFNIQVQDALYDSNYEYSSPLKKYFSLRISDLNYSNVNALVIWNFGDSNNPIEYRSSCLLDVVEHEFKYAGIYQITALIYIDSYVIHATMEFEVAEGFLPVYISPPAGLFYTNQMITLSTYDEYSKIYYTVDGSDPFESGTLYSSPFEITSSTLVKYAIEKRDQSKSEVFQAQYNLETINPDLTISPNETNYAGDITVTLNFDSASMDVFYYIGTNSPTPYTESFIVTSTGIVYFYGVSKTGVRYPTQSKYYNIDKVLPVLSISPSAGNYFNELNITLTPNKVGCITTYSGSGGVEETYTGTIDVANYLSLNLEDSVIYNIPFYAKVTDSFGRFTEYNRNYTISVDLVPPSLTFVETPSDPAYGSAFLFKFTVNEDTALEVKEAIVDIKVNDDAYEVYGLCKSGIIYQYYVFGVLPGEQSIFFKLTDKANNQTEVEFTWTVV